MASILIVDDEEDIRDSTKRLLEMNGFKVVTASSVDDSLKKLEKEKPDLILLDLMMPGKPVEDLFKKVRNIKIIIFSVITPSERDVITSGKKLDEYTSIKNVVDYVHKPFEIKELIAKINKYLEKD